MVDDGFEIIENGEEDEPVFESVRAFRSLVVHVNEGMDILDLPFVQPGKGLVATLVDDVTVETDTAGTMEFAAIVTEDQATEDFPAPKASRSISLGDRIDVRGNKP